MTPRPKEANVRMLDRAPQLGLGLVGAAALLVLAARVAGLPIVGGVVFGYLLLIEGRRARGESMADTLRLFSVAPRLGALLVGATPWMLLLTVLWGLAADAAIIDPTSPSTAAVRTIATVVSAITVLHLGLAAYRGGRLLDYAWPPGHLWWLARQLWRRGPKVEPLDARARLLAPFRALRDELQPVTAAKLALRATIAALIWLGPPSLLLAIGQAAAPFGLPLALGSAIASAVVLGWLPFLQARLAAENRLSAAFELRSVRTLIGRAPLSWMVAVLVTYVATLPVFVLRIFIEPDHAPTLFALVLLGTQFPARMAAGEAYRRAQSRPQPAWGPLRWLSTALVMPALAVYVVLVFGTPFIDASGRSALLSNPAYAIPWGFGRVAPAIGAALRSVAG